MSMAELEKTIRGLSVDEQNRIASLLTVLQIERDEGSLSDYRERMEREGRWIPLEEIESQLDVLNEE